MGRKRTRGRGRVVIVLLVVVAAAAGAWYMVTNRPAPTDMPTVRATIGKGQFVLYAPRTDTERETGLAAFRTIEPNQGMIFRGLPEGVQSIWMKNMKFDIDILWVSEKNQIIYMVQGASRNSYPEVFRNPVNARSSYVIELPADATLTHSIAVGQLVVVEQ